MMMLLQKLAQIRNASQRQAQQDTMPGAAAEVSRKKERIPNSGESERPAATANHLCRGDSFERNAQPHVTCSRHPGSGRQHRPQPQDPGTETQATDEQDPLDPLFTDDLLHTMVHAIPSPDTDTAEQKHRRKAAAMVLLRALDAQEPVEAAIAAHAVLAHHAALTSFRRAAQPNQSPAFADRQNGTAAILSGAFCRLLHTLEWRQNQTPLSISQDEPRWRR